MLKKKKKSNQIAINRRARYDYNIGDKFESNTIIVDKHVKSKNRQYKQVLRSEYNISIC